MSKIRLYNTLTKQLEDFEPIIPRQVSIYVCGPTVYDDAHLGHARCYITWDIVVRYLRFKGYEVKYVRNITDVDDKIINKAKENNVSPSTLTSKFIEEFAKDMALINVKKPDVEPKATEYITEMIEFIDKLIENGNAYEKNGDVYFRVSSYKDYGALSHQKLSDLLVGARVEADEKKENPLDFVLWKSVNNLDEIYWDSPWGEGRPGWHTECCVMINKLLGSTIDIHAGGNDLTFPHHENERAQMESLTGNTFVRYWLHNGFVNVDSEKMSKSLGNFQTIKELSKSYDNSTIRLFILTNHYRMPVDFSDSALSSAKKGIRKIQNAINDTKAILNQYKIDCGKSKNAANKLLQKILNFEFPENIMDTFQEISEGFCIDVMCATSPWAKSEFSSLTWRIKEFISAMDNDFNTSKALAILFELASLLQKNRTSIISSKKLDSDILSLMSLEMSILEILADILGFDFSKTKEVNNDQLSNNLMQLIIDIRKMAKDSKNWPLADMIRDTLLENKIILKDQKDGTTTWQMDE